MNTDKLVHDILLLGNGGVGKTSLIYSLKGEGFQKKYVENTDIEISTFELGPAIVNIYDTPGQYQYNMEENLENVFSDSAPSCSRSIVIMWDDSNTSYRKAMGFWTDIAENVGGDCPIIYAHNKTDVRRKEYDNAYHISCKRNDMGGLLDAIVATF
jgi:small GTP-binding protein